MPEHFLFDDKRYNTVWASDASIAACLADYIRQVSDLHRERGGNGRVFLVAHSMGGLAVRFALESGTAGSPTWPTGSAGWSPSTRPTRVPCGATRGLRNWGRRRVTCCKAASRRRCRSRSRPSSRGLGCAWKGARMRPGTAARNLPRFPRRCGYSRSWERCACGARCLGSRPTRWTWAGRHRGHGVAVGRRDELHAGELHG